MLFGGTSWVSQTLAAELVRVMRPSRRKFLPTRR
jgi:hypothetical protein